jgi:hypothetical protein
MGTASGARFNIHRPNIHRPKDQNTPYQHSSNQSQNKHNKPTAEPSAAAMCMSQQLPPIDLKKRLIRNLVAVNNAGADMPDEADILEAAQNGTPLDGDFLAHEARHLHEDEPEQPRPRETFEEIFTANRGIARRDDRSTTIPTPEVRNFVARWYIYTGLLADSRHEISTRLTGFFEFFEAFIRQHLPAKLDLDSWVGVHVVDLLSTHPGVKDGTALQWRPWMGTYDQRSTPPPAGLEFLGKYVGFVGRGTPGGPVWRKDRWGVPIPTSEEEADKLDAIEGKLLRAEVNLVRLSIRIANWLAYWLVYKYAFDRTHTEDGTERQRLTCEDIANAVIEILGDEWFDLPFDHDGKLRFWKHKRDFFTYGCLADIIRA